ncbi:sucrose-6-phosphate hydrolase [Saccharibacillus sp. JS10]|uniref:glycoside hydrolase family 32 protein n=1 Tax=Saccharibacillus sp. JS10 TaxID=2950552 RepID=UPI00210EF00F|nr:sucrose-6-phosphate hydrolase [Saccharibacillus sp. JS10]MCQ4086850.1 sucrose-6-phosphate hydrolase [Saccharibacillus sp. JS10]
MKMTKEQKYRLLEEAAIEEIQQLESLVHQSRWRQGYHIQPHIGLLNDPNGFTFYNGKYHLFYQWFPLGTDHGMKYWYHLVSSDLAHWEDAGIGLEPGGTYDSHGAYSGSGIEKDGKLYLMYTGNTRDEQWIRHPYQCLAVTDGEGLAQKIEPPVIESVPTGYTEHFRDPKVWKDGTDYRCVIGAQRENLTGTAVLYRSPDLVNWTFEGELQTSLPSFGYMWECPDYFELDDAGILLFCPQGLAPENEKFRNIYQSGYLLGEPLASDGQYFSHGEFIELDYGFDFYAPQTTLGADGERILVGWMGVPDLEYPTDSHGWAHCLTLPRELSVHQGKLIQRPAAGLKSLRGKKVPFAAQLINQHRSFQGVEGTSYELEFSICPIAENSAIDETDTFEEGVFGIEFRTGDMERTVLFYDASNGLITLDRSQSGAACSTEFGTTRSYTRNPDQLGQSITFRIFVDTSSVEIFVGDGEATFTARLFPDSASTGISFFAIGGSADFEGAFWQLDSDGISRELPAEIRQRAKKTE